jgi:hypothetical protein
LHGSAGPKCQVRCQVGAPSHFLPILAAKLVYPLKIIQIKERKHPEEGDAYLRTTTLP